MKYKTTTDYLAFLLLRLYHCKNDIEKDEIVDIVDSIIGFKMDNKNKKN